MLKIIAVVVGDVVAAPSIGSHISDGSVFDKREKEKEEEKDR